MATNMSVSVTLRLRDQFTSFLRNATQQLQQFEQLAQRLNRANIGTGIASQFSRISRQMRQLRDDMRNLTDGMSRLGRTNAGNSWTSRPLAEMRQMVQLQQQLIAGQQRLNAGGGGSGSMAQSHSGHFGSWYTRWRHRAGLLGHLAPSPYMLGGRGHRALHEAGVATGSLDSEYALLRALGVDRETYTVGEGDNAREVSGLDLAIERAREVSRLVPQVNEYQALHRFRELRYALADTRMALEVLPRLSQATAQIQAAMGAEHGGQMIDQSMEFVKSAEMAGQFHSAEEMNEFIDSFVKIAIASGGIVQPRQMFGAFKYARQSLIGFSERFRSRIMPELVQEFMSGRSGGGSSAGTGLMSWTRTISGVMPESYREKWRQAGLIDPATGLVLQRDLGFSDPDLWTEQVVFPALRRAGIDPLAHDQATRTRITQWVTDMFPNRMGAQIQANILSQFEQMQRRAGMMDLIGGVDEQTGLLQTWPSRLNALTTQLKGLGATLGELTQPLGVVVDKFTAFVSTINQMAQTDPNDLLWKGVSAAGAGIALWRGLGLGRLIGRFVGRFGLMGLGAGLGYLTGGGYGAMIGTTLFQGFGSMASSASGAATAAGGVLGAAAATGFAARFWRVLGGAFRLARGFAFWAFVLPEAFKLIATHWDDLKTHIMAIFDELRKAAPTWLGGEGKGWKSFADSKALADAKKDLGGWLQHSDEDVPTGLRAIAKVQTDFIGRQMALARSVDPDWSAGDLPSMSDFFPTVTSHGKGTVQSFLPSASTTTVGPITVNQTFNINGANADKPEAIGAAAGGAVRSGLADALSDGPHGMGPH